MWMDIIQSVQALNRTTKVEEQIGSSINLRHASSPALWQHCWSSDSGMDLHCHHSHHSYHGFNPCSLFVLQLRVKPSTLLVLGLLESDRMTPLALACRRPSQPPKPQEPLPIIPLSLPLHMSHWFCFCREPWRIHLCSHMGNRAPNLTEAGPCYRQHS